MPDLTTKDALLERMAAATDKIKTAFPAYVDGSFAQNILAENVNGTVTVAAGAYAEKDVDMTQNGYDLMGVIGFNVLTAAKVFINCARYKNQNTAVIRVWNLDSAEKTVSVLLRGLYLKHNES